MSKVSGESSQNEKLAGSFGFARPASRGRDFSPGCKMRPGNESAKRFTREGRMIAVDTNLLLYAHREDSPWHDAAPAKITAIAEAKSPWAIPWPCIHEFLAIVTHPRIYSPPTPLAVVINQVEAWLESPSLVLLAEVKATGRSFARRLSKAVSAVLKSMMLVSLRSAATMASVSCGLPIVTSAASQHSASSTRSWGKGREPTEKLDSQCHWSLTAIFPA